MERLDFMETIDMAASPSFWNSRIKSNSVLILIVTSLFFFYEFGIINIFDVLQQPISHVYNLTPGESGFVSSLYFYTDLLMIFPAGMLLDRYSPKLLIILALLTCAGGLFCIAVSHSLALLAVSRLVMGLGGGFCFAGCIRVAANWFNAEHMGRASGVIVTIGMLGGAVSQGPMQNLVNMMGWREAVIVVAMIGLVIALLIAVLVQNAPIGSKKRVAERAKHLQELGVWASLKMILRVRQNWLAALYTSLINMPIFMLGGFLGIAMLMRLYNYDHETAAWIASMLFLGAVFGSIAAGVISDWMHRRRRPMLIGGLLSLAAIFSVQFTVTHDTMLLATLFFALGFFTSAQIISYAFVAETNSPMVTSTAVGIISVLAVGGGAIIQPLSGWMLSLGTKTMEHGKAVYSSGAYQSTLWLIPVCFVAAIILASFIKETYCKQQID